MCDCLQVRLKKLAAPLNHTSTSIGKLVVDIKMFKICSPHCNVAALRGTYNGSCHFHCTVLAALCGAGVCLFIVCFLH